MKGIVFSVKRNRRISSNKNILSSITDFSFKRFFSFYGVQCFFLLTFILGVVLGSVSVRSASVDLLDRLDFLFVTNIDNRLELTPFDIFCSSFASNFIFLLACFLFSFSAWGMFALPVLCAFRGFGIGVSSVYLFSEYSITGVGFYILVVLPGTVLFLLAFITALKESFTQSINLLRMYFPSKSDGLLLRHMKTFFFRYFVVVVFATFSAVVDMLLWVVFANMFNF